MHTTTDAVQCAYEFLVAEPQRAIVVAFAALFDGGRSSLTAPFLEGEPEELDLPESRVWVFSIRPGGGAVPTEGDIARWERWIAAESNLVDWILIDGDRWTSVAT